MKLISLPLHRTIYALCSIRFLPSALTPFEFVLTEMP